MSIKEFIEDFAKSIPVKWDRFTEKDGDYDIYGWIERPDGKSDFLVLQLYNDDKGNIRGSYITSSSKYSVDIYVKLYGHADGHISCQKISNI